MKIGWAIQQKEKTKNSQLTCQNTTINLNVVTGVGSHAENQKRGRNSSRRPQIRSQKWKSADPSCWSNKNSPQWSVDHHHHHAGCVSGLVKLLTDKKTVRRTKSTVFYESRKKRFKNEQNNDKSTEWFLFIAEYKIVQYNFYIFIM